VRIAPKTTQGARTKTEGSDSKDGLGSGAGGLHNLDSSDCYRGRASWEGDKAGMRGPWRC